MKARDILRPVALLLCLICVASAGAQELPAFGFGDEDNDVPALAPAALPLALRLSGQAEAAVTVYADEVERFNKALSYNAGQLFSGSLTFDAVSDHAEASIVLAIDPAADQAVSIDEGFVRSYFGKLSLEAGLRTLTWGRVDSEGPLDVLNPLDYSDLSVTDQMERKIARPVVKASWPLASFTRLEAVLLPGFEANRLALDGRWAQAGLADLSANLQTGASETVAATLAAMVAGGLLNPAGSPEQIAEFYATQENLANSVGSSLAAVGEDGAAAFFPDTERLAYALYGLRLTTTAGSHDLGFQYFYGNRRNPAVSVDQASLFHAQVNPLEPESSTIAFNPSAISLSYDRYHQVGIDWATVLAGFSLRSELALNLTDDLSGDDPKVANPAVLWALGFDRTLPANLSLNMQGSGSVRLLHDKLGSAPLDAEGDSSRTESRLISRLSRAFFRDELELSFTWIWGVEDADWYALPELRWSRADTEIGLRAGFFGGSRSGALGQYRDNTWVSAHLSYFF